MIVDDIAAKSKFVRDFCVNAHILRVPLEIYPWDDSDGTPGLLWTEQGSPLEPKTPDGKLNCLWARPPFPTMILFSEKREPGIELVKVQATLAKEQDPELVSFAESEFGKNSVEHMMATQWHIILNIWLVGFSSDRGGLPLVVRYSDHVYLRDGRCTPFLGENIIMAGLERRVPWDDPMMLDAMEIERARMLYWMGIVNGHKGEGTSWWQEAKRACKKLPKLVERDLRDAAMDWNNSLSGAVSSLALLNCRNIIQERVEPPEGLQRARARKGKGPLYTYHQLRVKQRGMMWSLGRRERKGKTGLAVHWRRGHFKHYDKDRKLFGKQAGVWWWQPYLSGRLHDRFVDKEYAVSGLESSSPR